MLGTFDRACAYVRAREHKTHTMRQNCAHCVVRPRTCAMRHAHTQVHPYAHAPAHLYVDVHMSMWWQVSRATKSLTNSQALATD